MEKFETFVSRHGEHGIQAILENWEKFCGICHMKPMTLEMRWEVFMRETSVSTRVAA